MTDAEFDLRLTERLQNLEAGLSFSTAPSSRRALGIRRLAPLLGVVAAVSIAAGAAGAAVLDGVRGTPGIFSQGGALSCSAIADMTPPVAAPLLAELGYAVTWQLEDRDLGTSVQSLTAPADGFIVEGSQHGSALLIVVERGQDVLPIDHSCSP